ncbi:MAG: ATP-binding protein [Maritimibacter sp.]|uniref:ATP-binding protein n=1 Tax=Maritimibacter sp. TaxID=2003363 RepID=UPI001D740445|nr:AAA family ATPase [Maritimibacter sp.]MBL6429037.1 ATP-binding protein [Maritimibacter sp.]
MSALVPLAGRLTADALTASAKGEALAGFAPLHAALEAGEGAALADLAETFDLAPGEVELVAVLLACATSAPVAREVAEAAGGLSGCPVWLASALIGDLGPEALSASHALRRFEIVEMSEGARAAARLTLADPVLDRLIGAPVRDTLITARMSPVGAGRTGGALAGLRVCLARRGPDGMPPVVLAGAIETGRVADGLSGLGLDPWVLSASDIPDDPVARDRLARVWSREAALDRRALIVQAGEGARAGLQAFCDRIAGQVVVTGPVHANGFTRAVMVLPDSAPRRADAMVWAAALGPERADRVGSRALARVAGHFALGDADIRTVVARAGDEIDAAQDDDGAAARLWHHAARAHQVRPLPGTSLREPVFTWDDIVLPRQIEGEMRRITAHVRHATDVFDDWGFGRSMGGRGRGVAVLFSGLSGTGKTMAAEVLASALDLRLMVIDLSQIISKYIGETSKNIAAAFAEAERSGAVMVWDEGDSVWGARGQVGSATDRHVNAETGDLLARIEAFQGFTVVTTNMRESIDPAFRRRFRFALDFPLPSATERLTLWQKAFPPAAPTARINLHALADLPLSGGAIRNVALKSAFAAADQGGAITETMIEAELAAELAKEGKPAPVIRWGDIVQ